MNADSRNPSIKAHVYRLTFNPHPGLATVALLALASIAQSADPAVALKDAFKDCFRIGVALNQRQFTEQDIPGAALVKRQFNSVSPENAMKWANIHPRPGPDGYNFEAADRYVEFGEKNGMFIVGHTLIWHAQTPRWVFQGEGTNALTREALLQRMREHIHTVVGRYRGRIKAWDVVNEALNDDGSLRRSPWYRIIGEDYIAKAFEYAHEADPAAELRYNDYAIENERKRNGVIALVKKLQAQKAPISGLGSQMHANLTWPSAELLDTALTAFAELEIPISITELDVNASQRGQRNQSADVSQTAQAGGGGFQALVAESARQTISPGQLGAARPRPRRRAAAVWELMPAQSVLQPNHYEQPSENENPSNTPDPRGPAAGGACGGCHRHLEIRI